MQQASQLPQHITHLPCQWYLAWSQLDIHLMGHTPWCFPSNRKVYRFVTKTPSTPSATSHCHIWSHRLFMDILQNANSGSSNRGTLQNLIPSRWSLRHFREIPFDIHPHGIHQRSDRRGASILQSIPSQEQVDKMEHIRSRNHLDIPLRGLRLRTVCICPFLRYTFLYIAT